MKKGPWLAHKSRDQRRPGRHQRTDIDDHPTIMFCLALPLFALGQLLPLDPPVLPFPIAHVAVRHEVDRLSHPQRRPAVLVLEPVLDVQLCDLAPFVELSSNLVGDRGAVRARVDREIVAEYPRKVFRLNEGLCNAKNGR